MNEERLLAEIFFGQRDEPYIVPIQNRGSPTPSSTSVNRSISTWVIFQLAKISFPISTCSLAVSTCCPDPIRQTVKTDNEHVAIRKDILASWKTIQFLKDIWSTLTLIEGIIHRTFRSLDKEKIDCEKTQMDLNC